MDAVNLALLAAALLAGPEVAIAHGGGSPAAIVNAPTPGEPAAAEEVASTAYYRFHSDPWVNLHHFLYQWSRAEAGVASGRREVTVPERGESDRLDEDQSAVWEAAVAFYRAELAERGHFDDAMLEVKAALLGLTGTDGQASNVLPADVVPGLGPHLDRAMAVYRATWWPAHDRANRAWIDEIAPLVDRFEEEFVPVLERSLAGSWDEPLRVDASAYGNWAGGYTSNGPGHTVVISTDPRNRGAYGLELMIHEPGHVSALGRPGRLALNDAFERATGELPPRNLHHAIIFYTAGWTTRRIAEREGWPEHVPYAVDEGIVTFGGWQGLWEPLEAHWGPFLEGRGTREEAVEGLIEALDLRSRSG